jgi:hypothetical protein
LVQSIKNVGSVVAPTMLKLEPDKAPNIIFRFWNVDRFINGTKEPGAATPVELLAYAVSRMTYPMDQAFMRTDGGKPITLSNVYKNPKSGDNTPRNNKLYLDMEDAKWKPEAEVLKIMADNGITEPLDRYGAPGAARSVDVVEYERDTRMALMGSLSRSLTSGVALADDEEKKDEDEDAARALLASSGVVPSTGLLGSSVPTAPP